MSLRILTVFTLSAVLGIGLIGCSEQSQVTGPEAGPNIAESGITLSGKKMDMSGNTIADIAGGFASAETNKEFTILVTALETAGLVDVLASKGQYTVFAPTDAAFADLFANSDFTAEALLAEENRELLTTVLLYHVAPGRRYSEDVLNARQIKMKRGGFNFPILDGGNAFIRDTSGLTTDARLLAQEGLIDVEASNGVIHVIDQVLLP